MDYFKRCLKESILTLSFGKQSLGLVFWIEVGWVFFIYTVMIFFPKSLADKQASSGYQTTGKGLLISKGHHKDSKNYEAALRCQGHCFCSSVRLCPVQESIFQIMWTLCSLASSCLKTSLFHKQCCVSGIQHMFISTTLCLSPASLGQGFCVPKHSQLQAASWCK